jgi:hypothetical protein
MYIYLQTLYTVDSKKNVIFDDQDTPEDMTESGSLHRLINCEGFIEYYIVDLSSIFR